VALPVLPLLAEISLILVVPLLIGQLLRPFVRSVVEARKRFIGNTTNALILFILFAAFSNSFASRIWEGRGTSVVATGILGAALLLAIVSTLVSVTSGLTAFSREDRIAAFFCGSQKTLAAGIPIAQSIFSDTDLAVGVIVLPLMAYHLLQLVLGAFLSERFALNRA
jgi:sodium/bile acid cotransporter 7